MFYWEDLGNLFTHNNIENTKVFYAMRPIPTLIDNNRTVRVFCTQQDNFGRGYPSYFDFTSNEFKLKNFSKKPLFLRSNDSFDRDGIVLTSLFKNDNLYHLFYAGFRKINESYSMLSGSVQSKDLEFFDKPEHNLILGPVNGEELFRTACFVHKINNKFLYMYTGGNEFKKINGIKKPFYKLKSLIVDSFNKNLSEPGKVIFDLENDEHGHGAPYIIKIKNLYFLFFSVRKNNGDYKFGLGISNDCINWTRKDNDLNFSNDGFWGIPININGNIYMFYNKQIHGKYEVFFAKLKYHES